MHVVEVPRCLLYLSELSPRVMFPSGGRPHGRASIRDYLLRFSWVCETSGTLINAIEFW
jgi:hypothetical protein